MKGKMYRFDDPQLPSALQMSNLAEVVKLVPPSKDGIYADWPKDRAIFITNDNA